ncbi:L-seryl-tRNA(Sec) selenium transferase [Solirubrobacter soli]|uniref:L-seryl-tRNA(Sec) selenium transferase n=1 Tax=Solirubrobacter soli TaxID=363832 RepID=UPI00146B20B3|nr:L-seryl-tRNA(Sec) selenium transferase [Solirubrobacter soli]
MARVRDLPPVDTLAAQVDAPRALALAAARAVLAERRAELLGGGSGEADLGARARAWVADAKRCSLRRVLNATGVIVHTNLGRAPLADAAREAVARVAEGYSTLESDVAAGTRGSRHAHIEPLLCSLTGAEAGLAVNNGAGAALLAVAALAGPGRSVVVSRGQLVEIGGGFRVPDVIAQAGARLVEVGTTNRTRLADYERALDEHTAAILRVHQSNFRQLGFVEDVPVEALCELGVPVIDDVGSGALGPLDAPVGGGEDSAARGELAAEPSVRRSVAAGAALVVFSGDKLLGGPQAGVIVGRAEAVEAAKRHPLARALRIDKLSLAALEATLRLHRDDPAQIPVLAMLRAPRSVLEARARRLAEAVGGEVVESVARIGGGALPLLELPGPVVALPESLAAPLRAGDPPVLGRLEHGRLLLDPRTLADDELPLVIAAVKRGLTPFR